MLFTLLLSNFKDDGSEDWTDLLESLQIAFDEDCVELKKDIAQAFVPAVNRAKTCYRMFDEQDEAYGKGVLMLNTTLKDYEIMSVATEDKLKEAHSLAQVRVSVCAYIASLHGLRTRLRRFLSNSGKAMLSVTDSGSRYRKSSINMVIIENLSFEESMLKLICLYPS